jgi:hypothetical protein
VAIVIYFLRTRRGIRSLPVAINERYGSLATLSFGLVRSPGGRLAARAARTQAPAAHLPALWAAALSRLRSMPVTLMGCTRGVPAPARAQAHRCVVSVC